MEMATSLDLRAKPPGSAAAMPVKALAGLPVMLGAYVVIGWVVQSPAMVRIAPNSVAMGLNTALAFIASGVWLLYHDRQSPRWRIARTGMALALIVLFSLVVLEHAFDVSLGIDWVELHRKIQDQNLRPGRVALNTSLAFLLAGLAFVLAGQKQVAAGQLSVARFLALCVFLIGISGLLGYVLQLEWLYHWYRFNRMALPTAVGLCTLGAALLMVLRAPGAAKSRLADVEKKIVSRSSAILAALAGAFALFGFILLRDGVDSVMRKNLTQAADAHRELMSSTIEQNIRMALSVSNRPGLFNSVAVLSRDSGNAVAMASIDAVRQSFLDLGFGRLDIFDREQRLLTEPTPETMPVMSVRLHSYPIDAELIWADGYLLRTKIPLRRDGHEIGMIVGEQPLTALTFNLLNPRAAGKSGEHRLCAKMADRLGCFPSRLDPSVRELPFYIAGQPSFPVVRAILGEEGVTTYNDYRQRPVLVAYLTVERGNLALVTKQDIEELYQPLRRRLALMVALIAALVVGSGFILRSSVRPLASQLSRAETAARESAQALHESLTALEETSHSLRASEAEVRNLNAELEERVKLRTAALTQANEDLNQFAYAASHDLQEPLRNVSLYSQLIAQRYRGKLGEEADTHLDFVVQSAQRMQQLLRDVLAYTQVATGKSDPLDRPSSAESALAEATANLHATIQQAGAQVTHAVLPDVYVYPAHLVQLFQNLIANAIKYRSAAPPRIHVEARRQADRWLFSIRDNGIGIEPQYLEKIFGVFKRLHKDQYPGTGIGLAICQKIVHRYQGKIWAQSEPGKGTTFCFSLPATPLTA